MKKATTVCKYTLLCCPGIIVGNTGNASSTENAAKIIEMLKTKKEKKKTELSLYV